MVDDLSQADTFVPAASDGYAAQQNEMHTVSTFDWFSKKMLPTLVQASAIIAVAAVGLFGNWWLTALAGVGMLAFELTRAHFHNQADLNRELVLYHKEIAGALGKSPSEQLTIKDMRNAADEKIVGDKAIKPLKIELEHLAYRGRYNLLMGAVRAVVTTGAAILLHGMLSNAKHTLEAGNLEVFGSNVLMPLTGMLGVVTGATVGLEKLGDGYFYSHKPISVYHELTQLQDMSKKQAVNPEQVFDVVVKLDKDLASEIQQRLGKPYADLTYRNKIRVVQACENRAHAQALTDAINNDTLPVTAVAMSACQQMDWGNAGQARLVQDEVQGLSQVQGNAMPDKSHVLDLLSKRAAKAQLSGEHRIS